MSSAFLSVCLLSSLTRPLSPAEVRMRPQPGTLAYGLYAARAAASIRKGMTTDEMGAVLGRSSGVAGSQACYVWWYPDLGLNVVTMRQGVTVGGKRKVALLVDEVNFNPLRAMRYRPARR
jgi:hypothetical protein